MKRLLLNIITAASAILAVYSCADISSETDATGFLSINVEKDSPNDIIYVKGAGDEENFVVALAIYDSEGELVKQADDYTALGTVELPTGYYRAVATSGTNVEGAGFNSPYYRGEKEFSIKRGEVSNLDIVCRLANIKVTVNLSQDITEKFSHYEFKVTGNDGSSLVYNEELDNFSQEGYFSEAVTELGWSMNFTDKNGVVYEPIAGKYSDVKPCRHYKFNFTLTYNTITEDVGGSIFKIQLDDSVNQKEYDLNLDFGKKNPTVISNLPETGDFPYYYGDPCSISISSESEIKSLTLSHNDSRLENAGLKRSVELAGASQALLSELAGIGIVTGGIVKTKAEPESAAIDFSSFLSRLQAGKYAINVRVENQDGYTEVAIKTDVRGERPGVDIKETVMDEVWAMFAKVSSSYEILTAEPSGLGFRYRDSDGGSWKNADPATVKVNKSSRTFSAEIYGLQPSHSYIIQAVSSDAEGPEKSFRTENAATVPNLNFDDWYQNGKVWYPGVSADNCFWDTANGGTKVISIYPTVPEESNVIAGKAAKLESMSAFGLLAAGNIYTGKFGKQAGLGAELDWGVPFTSRPLALKGYYSYSPKAIDKTKAPYENLEGQPDIGQIQILLTDWDAPFHVNTSTGTFVDMSDSHILAYGAMDLNATSGYKEFTINVDYRDRTKTPTYIVIVASASKYGDYFTGGIGSILYLDEFELVYDPAQLD